MTIQKENHHSVLIVEQDPRLYDDIRSIKRDDYARISQAEGRAIRDLSQASDKLR